MKKFIFGLLFSLTAIIAWGVMGMEIFANGMDNLGLIEVCAYIMMVCLIGNLIVALSRLFQKKE